MADRHGVRGYISTRPVRGTIYPARVQNLVVRDYVARHGLHYLLSSVEYAMPGCFMMFADILNDVDRLEGVVFFSMFMLPERPAGRHAMYDRFLTSGATLHAALENRALSELADVSQFEDTLLVAGALERAPFGGHYDRAATPLAPAGVSPFITRTL